MRESIRELINICIDTLPPLEPIYEFGSCLVPGQEALIDLRPLFRGKKFVGTDMHEGPGVDMVLDLQNIDLKDESIGTALVIDTLEHVEFVRKAANEAYRVLKPKGMLIISSVMNFPIHAYPSDYWRFTPEAFVSLLRPFESSFVESLGRKDFPHTVIGIGIKDKIPLELEKELADKIASWRKAWRFRVFSGWKEWARRLMPPIFVESYMQIRMRSNRRQP